MPRHMRTSACAAMKPRGAQVGPRCCHLRERARGSGALRAAGAAHGADAQPCRHARQRRMPTSCRGPLRTNGLPCMTSRGLSSTDSCLRQAGRRSCARRHSTAHRLGLGEGGARAGAARLQLGKERQVALGARAEVEQLLGDGRQDRVAHRARYPAHATAPAGYAERELEQLLRKPGHGRERSGGCPTLRTVVVNYLHLNHSLPDMSAPMPTPDLRPAAARRAHPRPRSACASGRAAAAARAARSQMKHTSAAQALFVSCQAQWKALGCMAGYSTLTLT